MERPRPNILHAIAAQYQVSPPGGGRAKFREGATKKGKAGQTLTLKGGRWRLAEKGAKAKKRLPAGTLVEGFDPIDEPAPEPKAAKAKREKLTPAQQKHVGRTREIYASNMSKLKQQSDMGSIKKINKADTAYDFHVAVMDAIPSAFAIKKAAQSRSVSPQQKARLLAVAKDVDDLSTKIGKQGATFPDEGVEQYRFDVKSALFDAKEERRNAASDSFKPAASGAVKSAKKRFAQ